MNAVTITAGSATTIIQDKWNVKWPSELCGGWDRGRKVYRQAQWNLAKTAMLGKKKLFCNSCWKVFLFAWAVTFKLCHKAVWWNFRVEVIYLEPKYREKMSMRTIVGNKPPTYSSQAFWVRHLMFMSKKTKKQYVSGNVLACNNKIRIRNQIMLSNRIWMIG